MHCINKAKPIVGQTCKALNIVQCNYLILYYYRKVFILIKAPDFRSLSQDKPDEGKKHLEVRLKVH